MGGAAKVPADNVVATVVMGKCINRSVHQLGSFGSPIQSLHRTASVGDTHFPKTALLNELSSFSILR